MYDLIRLLLECANTVIILAMLKHYIKKSYINKVLKKMKENKKQILTKNKQMQKRQNNCDPA